MQGPTNVKYVLVYSDSVFYDCFKGPYT